MLRKALKILVDLAIGVAFAAILVFQIPVAVSQPAQPITKTGSSCPSGYYRSGSYCVPHKKAKPAIERKGKDCPRGYYRSGNYCKRL